MSERYEWLEGKTGHRSGQRPPNEAARTRRRGGGYATEVEDNHQDGALGKRKAKKVMFKLPEEGGHREALR